MRKNRIHYAEDDQFHVRWVKQGISVALWEQCPINEENVVEKFISENFEFLRFVTIGEAIKYYQETQIIPDILYVDIDFTKLIGKRDPHGNEYPPEECTKTRGVDLICYARDNFPISSCLIRYFTAHQDVPEIGKELDEKGVPRDWAIAKYEKGKGYENFVRYAPSDLKLIARMYLGKASAVERERIKLICRHTINGEYNLEEFGQCPFTIEGEEWTIKHLFIACWDWNNQKSPQEVAHEILALMDHRPYTSILTHEIETHPLKNWPEAEVINHAGVLSHHASTKLSNQYVFRYTGHDGLGPKRWQRLYEQVFENAPWCDELIENYPNDREDKFDVASMFKDSKKIGWRGMFQSEYSGWNSTGAVELQGIRFNLTMPNWGILDSFKPPRPICKRSLYFSLREMYEAILSNKHDSLLCEIAQHAFKLPLDYTEIIDKPNVWVDAQGKGDWRINNEEYPKHIKDHSFILTIADNGYGLNLSEFEMRWRQGSGKLKTFVVKRARDWCSCCRVITKPRFNNPEGKAWIIDLFTAPMQPQEYNDSLYKHIATGGTLFEFTFEVKAQEDLI